MKTRQLKPADRIAPKLQHHWDWRAAANFIAGGAGGGLLAAAAVASVTGADVRLLIAAGMVLIASGLTCVWFEIGRPWRALNVFRHLKTSWMTREASVAPLLYGCGGLALVTGHAAFITLAGLFGAAFLYSQARILAADKGIPAWRHRACLPLMVATGLAEGAGFVAIAAPRLLPQALAGVALTLLALLAARAWLWKRYLAGLAADGAPDGSRRALAAVDTHFVLLGHALPAALAAAVLLGVPGATGLMTIAGLLAVAAGARLKFTLVTRAAYTQGFALKHLPVRGRGSAGPAVKPGWGGAA